MDPYFDIIPNDRGEEIRKRMRGRDGEDNKGRPVREQILVLFCYQEAMNRRSKNLSSPKKT